MPSLETALAETHRIVSGFGATQFEKGTKSQVVVKGFASMAGVDRDGDNIDPLLFDIESYMKNPTVYWNHKPWRTQKGNEVSIGSTEKMYAVSVKQNPDNASLFDLFDLTDNSLVETIDGEQYLVKDGDKGLWVHVRVSEPEVVKMVYDNRANAFSWKGALRKTHDTRELKIDMYEVSLVTVPAQNRSLFAIAKAIGADANSLNGLLVQVSPSGDDIYTLWEGQMLVNDAGEQRFAIAVGRAGGSEVMFLPYKTVRTVEEARAVAAALTFAKEDSSQLERLIVMLKPTGKRTSSGSDVYETEVVEVMPNAAQPTQKEISLLRLLEEKILEKNTGGIIAVDDNAKPCVEPTTKTADNAAAVTEGGDSEMESKQILDMLGGMTKTLDELNSRMATQDARIEEVVKAQTKAANEVATTLVEKEANPAAASTTQKADDPAKNADDVIAKQIADALTAITSSLGAISKRMDEQDNRLNVIEKSPATASTALKDEDEDDGESDAIVKRLASLDGAKRSQFNRTVLGLRMIPDVRAAAR